MLFNGQFRHSSNKLNIRNDVFHNLSKGSFKLLMSLINEKSDISLKPSIFSSWFILSF